MYIKKFQYGGFDYHDAKEIIKQLKWKGIFDVPEEEVKACIFADIMECFPYADGERVQAALREEKAYLFPIPTMEDGKLTYSEEIDGHWADEVQILGYKVSEYYAFGQVFYETEYAVEDIAKENVCYIPEEQFYAVYKGAPIISRCYHEPFERYAEAALFLDSMEKHDPKSELVILVHDRLKIMESEWYKQNIKVVEELRLHPEKREVFLIQVNDHLSELERMGDGPAVCDPKSDINRNAGTDTDENLTGFISSHVNDMVDCIETMIRNKTILLQEEWFEATDTEGHSYETRVRYKDKEYVVYLYAMSEKSYERQAAVDICQQMVREALDSDSGL